MLQLHDMPRHLQGCGGETLTSSAGTPSERQDMNEYFGQRVRIEGWSADTGPKATRDVFAALARGFGGSILFALPLLMTMEMWWLGFYLGPTRILLLMAVFFPILIGVAHYIGFRDTDGAAHAALHAITGYGIAILSSGVMLGILGVLKPGMGWQELVGKTAIQAGPGALGALLAESHFGASDDKKERRDDAAYVEHLFFMVVGALFVALTVA